MSAEHVKRLETLKAAAQEYFTRTRARLQAQVDFIDAIAKKRGGTIGLQDQSAQQAAQILENSINDYLGRAPAEE